MQCRNGGWGSFDKDNTKMIFQYIPFADHNAMLDPPTVDITGRMLEMLAIYGYTRDDKRVEKAIKFIFNEQEPDGSWFGRWGVNYLYGTFLVLRGLDAIGIDHLEPQIQQAAEWIRMVQNPDGGWGETCGSYDDPNTRGIGPSTPSQTAWALLGLLAAGDDRSDSVAKGVRWLLDRQRPTAAGTSPWARGPRARPSSPEPDSPEFFIWHTRCTASISRCWRLRPTSGPWSAPRSAQPAVDGFRSFHC